MPLKRSFRYIVSRRHKVKYCDRNGNVLVWWQNWQWCWTPRYFHLPAVQTIPSFPSVHNFQPSSSLIVKYTPLKTSSKEHALSSRRVCVLVYSTKVEFNILLFKFVLSTLHHKTYTHTREETWCWNSLSSQPTERATRFHKRLARTLTKQCEHEAWRKAYIIMMLHHDCYAWQKHGHREKMPWQHTDMEKKHMADK